MQPPLPHATVRRSRFGDLSVDVEARQVRVAGRPVELTRTEFDILEVLTHRPRLAYSRRQLIDEAWDPGWVVDENIVDVHVVHLRRKLGDDSPAPDTSTPSGPSSTAWAPADGLVLPAETTVPSGAFRRHSEKAAA